MLRKVLSYVNQHRMLEHVNKIVVGVSGGADSVCLLFVLHKLRTEWPITLEAAHVNHGLRGEEARRDQEYVRKLCEEMGIPFHLKTVDLQKLSKEKKWTEEEAGRLVRYDFFRQLAEETGAERIAVGHNANDNAETLLLHLIRGAGLKGLGGMAPVQGKVIRPLLCVKRQEIEEFLRKMKLEFCMDRTNLEDTYTRNRIRHQLLPFMEELNPEAVDAINHTALLCRESSDFIEEAAARTFEKYCRWEAVSGTAGRRFRLVLEKEALLELDPVVADALLWQVLERIAGSRKDLGSIHLEGLKSLWKGETGKRMNLPYQVEAENQYGALVLWKKGEINRLGVSPAESEQAFFMENRSERQERRWELPCPMSQGKIELDGGASLIYSVEKYEKNMIIPKKRYTKWLDCDIIKGTLRFRTREPGDRIRVLSTGGSQKLKDYFINEKIPRQERDKLLLLAEGHEILWVVGYRISEAFKVTDRTKHVLKLTYLGGAVDGGKDSGFVVKRNIGESHSGIGKAD